MTQRDANPSGQSDGVTSLSTSTSLLARIKDNDASAWQRLVELYAPLVYRWCRLSNLHSEDAADVAQEVFKAVATGIDGYRGVGQRGSFRAWLRTITRNKVYDHFRRRRGQPAAQGGTAAQQDLLEVAEPAEPTDASDDPRDESSLWHDGLDLVRGEFEDRTWQAFWRVVVDGQNPADVAAELRVSAAAVYQAKYRILRRLRQELTDLENPD